MSAREPRRPPRRINHLRKQQDFAAPWPGLSKLVRLLAQQQARAASSHVTAPAWALKESSDE